MDLEFSEEQRMFADALGRFLEKEYAFDFRAGLVAERAWGSERIWSGLAELGCFMVVVPEAAGGLGGKAIDVGVIGRVMGRNLVIEPVRSVVVAAILLANVEGASDLLEALMTGSERFAVLDLALRSDEHFIIPGAVGADIILLADDRLTVIPRDHNFRVVQLLDDSMAVESATVQPGGRTFEPGPEWSLARSTAQAFSRIFLCFEALGSIEAALAGTVDYVRERRQFNKPIAQFQVVQHRIAEMAVAAKEAEAAALLAALTFDAVGSSSASDRAIAAAVLTISRAAELVADSAVQLHGGMGVSNELSISAHFRKLQSFRFLCGSMESVADEVVKSAAYKRSAVLLDV